MHSQRHLQACKCMRRAAHATYSILQWTERERERVREMAKRVHSSMANKPRQKCCPSVASLPARAAAERAGREREEREI